MWQYQNTDELYHHGVLGMKWGVRRYQNEDGSLTSAGKKRIREKDTSNWSEDAKKFNTLKKKSVNEMSDSELRSYTNRANLEQQYNKLNPSSFKKGMTYAATAAAALGTAATVISNSKKLIKIGKKAYAAADKAWRNYKYVHNIYNTIK